MVELVDTQDLKSCGHCGRAGSIPAPGTKEKVVCSGQPFFIHKKVTLYLVFRIEGDFMTDKKGFARICSLI